MVKKDTTDLLSFFHTTGLMGKGKGRDAACLAFIKNLSDNL